MVMMMVMLTETDPLSMSNGLVVGRGRRVRINSSFKHDVNHGGVERSCSVRLKEYNSGGIGDIPTRWGSGPIVQVISN